MSEVMNPFTTEETEAFGIQVLDKNSFILYETDTNSPTVSASASDFAFSFVSSESPVNGESTVYSVSLTLSVNTPVGAIC